MRGSLPRSWERLASFLGSLIGDRITRRNYTPLPEKGQVLRLARPSKDYSEKRTISAIQLDLADAFVLSTIDRNSVPPYLSVWETSCTTEKQAYAFLLENSSNSDRKLVLRLKVKEVRKVEGSSGEGRFHSGILNILWVHLSRTDKETTGDLRPGASGHSGIIGLDEKSCPEELSKTQRKNLRKDLRLQLAKLAARDHHLLDN